MAIKMNVGSLDLSKMSEDELKILQRKIRNQHKIKTTKKSTKTLIPSVLLDELKKEYVSLSTGMAIEVSYKVVYRYVPSWGGGVFQEFGDQETPLMVETKRKMKEKVQHFKKKIAAAAKQYKMAGYLLHRRISTHKLPK